MYSPSMAYPLTSRIESVISSVISSGVIYSSYVAVTPSSTATVPAHGYLGYCIRPSRWSGYNERCAAIW